jgi:CxxC motif-containing protein (DUF1111 family)
MLAPPPRGDIDSSVLQGETIFHAIGCPSCHVASFTTSARAHLTSDREFVNIAALRSRRIEPYSDFLLHDMGPELAQDLALGRAGPSEYRTAPLWGHRFRLDDLLHDGRAANLHQALLFHGGEAKAARAAYLALGKEEAALLKAFLGSL